MKKIHVVSVALLLGVAAVFGVVAATRTAGIGSTAQTHVSGATIAARERRLALVERRLQRSLRARPPALPTVPARPAAPVLQRAASPPPQIVYRRPAPLVVVKSSSHHGEHEGAEGRDSGGGDD